jgi:hypothetical protein
MIEIPVPRRFHSTKFTDETRLAIETISLGERLRMIEDMHVDHPQFRQHYKFVRDFHHPVGGDVVGRGQMKMLVGDFRSGKTRVAEHYEADVNRQRAERHRVPVVHVECASNWTAKHVMIATIEKLTGKTQSDKPQTEQLVKATMRTLKNYNVELWIIDDVGWPLSKRSSLSNDLMSNLKKVQRDRLCNILLVGSAATHRQIEVSHLYIGGLLHRQVHGLDWHRGGKDDYVFYLDDLDDLLPFRRKSGLAMYAPDFYDLSKGSPAFTGLHVGEAAQNAIRDGADRIEIKHLVEMSLEAKSIGDPFNHFVDTLKDEHVGLRELIK